MTVNFVKTKETLYIMVFKCLMNVYRTHSSHKQILLENIFYFINDNLFQIKRCSINKLIIKIRIQKHHHVN